MNFRTFESKYSRYPVIKSAYFALEQNPAYIRRLVSEWTKKEWLIELRRGMYIINQDRVLNSIESFNLANILYEPSYISLEAALSFHGMIPEAVVTVTSVSTRKTARFSNAIGTFSYSQIKKDLFWGYQKHALGKTHALIATPHKALLDLIYLRRREFKDGQQVLESLRLGNLRLLNSRDLLATAKRFNIPAILMIAKGLSAELNRGIL